MAGNVFEWTTDWYGAYPGSKAKNTGYGQVYKVIRGGGFDAHSRDSATMHRAVLPPRVRSEWAGFRCARDVDSSSAVSVAPNKPVTQ
jgi:formylglycine-generating enzyme required for sulfatase activity